MAGKLVGRYLLDRAPLAAVALTGDTAVRTCIGNDYGYKDVFARQVRALARPEDILVVFSTSGNSPNVLEALAAARAQEAHQFLLHCLMDGIEAKMSPAQRIPEVSH